jgi:ABC-type multidrug transport system fused ATPase/permease subunit
MVEVTKKILSRFIVYSIAYMAIVLMPLAMYVIYFTISHGYFSLSGTHLNIALITFFVVGLVFSIVAVIGEKRNQNMNKLNEDVNNIVNEIIQNKQQS